MTTEEKLDFLCIAEVLNSIIVEGKFWTSTETVDKLKRRYNQLGDKVIDEYRQVN